MPCNCLILRHPLLLLPAVFASIRVFSNESALCIRWPKHWRFSFSISPSSEYLRLISFRLTGLILQSKGLIKYLKIGFSYCIYFLKFCWEDPGKEIENFLFFLVLIPSSNLLLKPRIQPSMNSTGVRLQLKINGILCTSLETNLL